MIDVDDFLYFLDEALEGMATVVTDLGDDLANRRLDLPGANSPYAVLFHCLGVMEYWGGAMVAGRTIEVLSVDGRAITEVRIGPASPDRSPPLTGPVASGAGPTAAGAR